MGLRYILDARQIDSVVWEFEYQTNWFVIALGALIYARCRYDIVEFRGSAIRKEETVEYD